MTYENPVIRGFYPDPSLCRANGRYYLVCSSFHYFPGVPLFESRDLINWKHIGHCLTRESQLPLSGAHSSQGIYAPTIRFDGGRFYMITTNTSGGGNFYVWTDDIYGEWSEPVYIDQSGIDPSLYFEDGKAYAMGNSVSADGRAVIIQYEIDIATGKRLSASSELWHGTGGRYLESPHLYKIGKYYYLMAAEGGTEYGHMVTYARSEGINGPFVPYPGNPVLTNRNLGGYRLQGTGHADLIEDADGNWWIFFLAFRQIDSWQQYHHLGRETCLMPVSFDDGCWFTAGQNGTAALSVSTDRIPSIITQSFQKFYTFSNLKPHNWCFLRNYNKECYKYDGSGLKLKSYADTLDSIGSPTFAGLRQAEFDMELTVCVSITDGEAGVTVYMDENHHYDLFIRESVSGGYEAALRLNIGDIRPVVASAPLNSAEAVLRITSDALCYRFFCLDGLELGSAKTRYVSTEVAGGFTGVVLGLYSQYGKNGSFNEFKDLSLRYPVTGRPAN